MKIKTLFLYILILFFSACSNVQIQKAVKVETTLIKNDTLLSLSKEVNSDSLNTHKNTTQFFNEYFKPWDSKKVTYSKIQAMWGQNYKYKSMYLENHRLASSDWFDKQIENSNFDKYNTSIKYAISLKNTNIRVFPTNSMMFKNPRDLGEGYPFDYNQNSLLKINTPLIVSHLSKDEAWAYIQSFSVGGWVSIKDIAFVDDKFKEEFKTNNYFVAIKESFPIYDPIFREYVKIGTIFPKKDKNYIIAKADENQNAKISYIKLENTVEKMPLEFNSDNVLKIANELIDEPYGWGGNLNHRDCSSFTKDFFAPFGKYLHRNSKAQKKNGRYHDIYSLSKEEKKEYIKENAIAFSTLIYMKGHIMLYVGIKDDEPLVMHNIWSIRLKNKEGEKYRHIIGKTSITSIEAGKEIEDFDENNNILRNVRGIVILD